MRICILNEFFYPDMMGGTPKVLSELAAKLNHFPDLDVSVVTSANSYRDTSIKYPAYEDWNGVKIHRVKAPHWTSKRTPQRLAGNLLFTHRATRKLLRDVSCDVVLVSSAPVTLPMAAQAYLKRRGIPYVYVVYDLDPDRAVVLGVADPKGLPVRELTRHQRKWLHGAQTVVAIGRCMRDVLTSRYGVPEERISVIEVGADADTVRPLPRQTRFRLDHGIEGFVVLYSGNFGKYHDFDTILNAAKLVGAQNDTVNFVLVGRGAKKAHIQERVIRERIDNIRVFDFVSDEDYGDLLASADTCLITLEAGMEGLCVPSKFYSILASGRPTLAVMPSKSEVAYAVDGEDIGVVVELGDPAGLASTILRLCGQPKNLEEQGVRARALFEERYTSDAIASKFRNTLASAASRIR